MSSVFISYAKEDILVARKLYAALKSVGAQPWLDEECLFPGQKWESEIQNAIKRADYFIALLSTHSLNKKGYVQKELKRGLSVYEELPDSKIFLIPARVDECNPEHTQLREIQWVDLFPNFDEGLFKILSVISFSSEIDAPSLSGTSWMYVDPDEYYEKMELEFFPGGGLSYTQFDDRYTDGSWKQAGALIYFEVNGKYAQYKGKITGDTMAGDGQNIKGLKWIWSARRIAT